MKIVAALNLRPGDLFPEQITFSVYEPCILACMAASAGVLLRQFAPATLAARPQHS